MALTIKQATVHDMDQFVPMFDGYRQFYGGPSEPEIAREFLLARLRRRDSVIFMARPPARTLLAGPAFSAR